jgi:hypothetical protein
VDHQAEWFDTNIPELECLRRCLQSTQFAQNLNAKNLQSRWKVMKRFTDLNKRRKETSGGGVTEAERREGYNTVVGTSYTSFANGRCDQWQVEMVWEDSHVAGD